VVKVISSMSADLRFLPRFAIHIFPRAEQSERIKLESILTLWQRMQIESSRRLRRE